MVTFCSWEFQAMGLDRVDIRRMGSIHRKRKGECQMHRVFFVYKLSVFFVYDIDLKATQIKSLVG